jgi:hypothetical protein
VYCAPDGGSAVYVRLRWNGYGGQVRTTMESMSYGYTTSHQYPPLALSRRGRWDRIAC